MPYDSPDHLRIVRAAALRLRTASGQVCGKIIWKAKRAENWSEKWLQKLKDDQQEANADIAVLATTAMPKGNLEAFCRMGDVWVVSPQVMRPVGEILRVILLESQRLKQVNTGHNEKTEQLYNYWPVHNSRSGSVRCSKASRPCAPISMRKSGRCNGFWPSASRRSNA